MKRACLLVAGLALLGSLAGCVSASKYNTLLSANEKQKDKIDQLRQDVERLTLSAAQLRADLKREEEALAGLKRTEAARDQQISLLKDRIQTLTGKIDALARAPAPKPVVVEVEALQPEHPPVELPAAVVQALGDLAAREPALEFDARTGRCRFVSEVLFVKGSEKVRPEFEKVLKRFAAIFTGVGKGLNLRIEGHTDSQPIRNIGTRSAHPTNWHLAAHRAIEVLRVLYRAGIDQDRMEVVAFGSERPIADNRTAAGRARNRRVEIYVVNPAGKPVETAAGASAASG